LESTTGTMAPTRSQMLVQLHARIEDNLRAIQALILQSRAVIEDGKRALRVADDVLRCVRRPGQAHIPGPTFDQQFRAERHPADLGLALPGHAAGNAALKCEST
jgi:hypothetical protein